MSRPTGVRTRRSAVRGTFTRFRARVDRVVESADPCSGWRGQCAPSSVRRSRSESLRSDWRDLSIRLTGHRWRSGGPCAPTPASPVRDRVAHSPSTLSVVRGYSAGPAGTPRRTSNSPANVRSRLVVAQCPRVEHAGAADARSESSGRWIAVRAPQACTARTVPSRSLVVVRSGQDRQQRRLADVGPR